MGDGTFNGYYFTALYRFLFNKRTSIINVLIIKYDIHCNIRYFKPHLPIIHVIKKHMPKLRSTVKPFIHKSMMYKLGL